MKAIHHFSIALCLSLPALALAENESGSIKQARYEPSAAAPNAATKSTGYAPADPDATTKSTGTSVDATKSVQANKKYLPDTDPVPLSDYVNGGYYNQ